MSVCSLWENLQCINNVFSPALPSQQAIFFNSDSDEPSPVDNEADDDDDENEKNSQCCSNDSADVS